MMNVTRRFLLFLLGFTLVQPVGAESIARYWNEENLAAIRQDFPHPSVQARNLFSTSVAMYDTWAAYSTQAVGYTYNELAVSGNIATARHEAISYAAYRVLVSRYTNSLNSTNILLSLDAALAGVGYDKAITTTNGTTPAAVGNRVAAAIIKFTLSDGSNESGDYEDITYSSMNEPLLVSEPGTVMADPNRWQPLTFTNALSQNGLPTVAVQEFLGSHWRDVRPFALTRTNAADVYFDPGLPPQLGGAEDAAFKSNSVEVVRFSSYLDPDVGAMIDVSPGARGNNTLGFNDGSGHPTNPVTGLPYPTNLVNHGDFGRVVAELWADGPASETAPGHWNLIANEVLDDPMFTRDFEGSGTILDELEWDTKMYFAINCAVHDAAVAAWNAKREYDYVRPISSIRYMGQLGQSSDSMGPSYHVDGLPLVSGLVEVVTATSSQFGERHVAFSNSIGKVALFCWPHGPDDPTNEYSGVEWVLAENWLPYQRATFVTPAFAGYISGHSTFSRAAAEVLTAMTGTEFFPGGSHTYSVVENDFLGFEEGPSTSFDLQWATYYDASDEAGISRLYGGIHVAPDDGPGRVVGSKVGIEVYDLAKQYWDGSILEEETTCDIQSPGPGIVQVEWDCVRGMYYKLQKAPDMTSAFTNVTGYVQEGNTSDTLFEFIGAQEEAYYRVLRSLEP